MAQKPLRLVLRQRYRIKQRNNQIDAKVIVGPRHRRYMAGRNLLITLHAVVFAGVLLGSGLLQTLKDLECRLDNEGPQSKNDQHDPHHRNFNCDGKRRQTGSIAGPLILVVCVKTRRSRPRPAHPWSSTAAYTLVGAEQRAPECVKAASVSIMPCGRESKCATGALYLVFGLLNPQRLL